MEANRNVKTLDSDWPYILTPVKMILDPGSNLQHIRNIWSKFGPISLIGFPGTSRRKYVGTYVLMDGRRKLFMT